ncbi:hypothetical protein M513_13898, partial [Trichuris suis]
TWGTTQAHRSIELVPGDSARLLKCRSVPFALVERVKKENERLANRESLEPVLWSDWASSIVTIVKKGGDIRICSDYTATVNLVCLPSATLPEMMTTISEGAWCLLNPACILRQTRKQQKCLRSPLLKDYLERSASDTEWMSLRRIF